MFASVGEGLEWTEMPSSRPGPGEVLVEVAAAGVNRADLLQRRGLYPPPPGASEIIGLECSGWVRALGPGAVAPAVGTPVCALLAGGGYASEVIVPAAQVLPLPPGVPLLAAAGVVEAAATAWSNLVTVGRLSAGETVLIHGGAGGVGSHAIQLARARGARVIATAGGPDRVESCRQWGADEVIDYRAEPFAQRCLDLTGSNGVDVILDVVGGRYLADHQRCLADGGRLVIIGLTGGARAELDLARMLSRRQTVAATALRTRPVSGPGSKAEILAELATRVWPLFADGSISPVIGATLPIEQAAQAHALLASEAAPVGKILLVTPAGREL